MGGAAGGGSGAAKIEAPLSLPCTILGPEGPLVPAPIRGNPTLQTKRPGTGGPVPDGEEEEVAPKLSLSVPRDSTFGAERPADPPSGGCQGEGGDERLPLHPEISAEFA